MHANDQTETSSIVKESIVEDTHTKPISYVNVLNEEPTKKKVNFRSLNTNETVKNSMWQYQWLRLN